MTARRVALVLGAGGLKCGASVGLFRVLEREGIPVERVVGCSGGAIYGALFALGLSAGKLTELSGLWEGVFQMSWRALASTVAKGLFAVERYGIVSDEKINAALLRLFGSATFADTRVPLSLVATDIRTGEKVVLEKGSLFDAVRASIAIPLVIPPWTVSGRVLVDGAATDPLPVDVAIREGSDLILAMAFEEPCAPAVDSFRALVRQTSSITVNSLLRATYAFYSFAHHAEVIPILPEIDRPVGLADHHLSAYLDECGERAAERELPYLRRLLDGEKAAEAS